MKQPGELRMSRGTLLTYKEPDCRCDVCSCVLLCCVLVKQFACLCLPFVQDVFMGKCVYTKWYFLCFKWKGEKNKTKIQTLLGLLNNEEMKAPLGRFGRRIPTYVGAVHILSSQPLYSLLWIIQGHLFYLLHVPYVLECGVKWFHGLMSSVMADILIREDQKKKRGKKRYGTGKRQCNWEVRKSLRGAKRWDMFKRYLEEDWLRFSRKEKKAWERHVRGGLGLPLSISSFLWSQWLLACKESWRKWER